MGSTLSALGSKAKAAASLSNMTALENGLLVPGNIDLTKRPVVQNSDGSISTVRSMGFNDGQHEVLIPTVHPGGYIMSDDEAIDHYFKTGQHLGKFATPEASNTYAEQLHNDQADMYLKRRK